MSVYGNRKDKFMNKKKWGKTAAGLKEKLQFLRLDEDLDDEDDL